MNAQAIVLVLGGFLILLGLVGGGFAIKGTALPKLQTVPRVASVVIGLSLIVLGIFGFDEDEGEDAAPAAVIAPKPGG